MYLKIFLDRAKDSAWVSAPVVIGFCTFLWFTGGVITDPGNLTWILNSNTDAVQHYVGWLAFRHAPFIQWPLGLNLPYGEAVGSSVVFTDSLPLFAFVFKAFRWALPPDFQYMGTWILMCFVMQAIFAWRLLRKGGADKVAVALGTCLLTASPIMLFRLLGHEALIGHWTLLAALDLYFGSRYRWAAWTTLLCVTSWIHPYLLAMVASVWIAHLAAVLIQERKDRTRSLFGALCTVACVVGGMDAVGYFMPGSAGAGGYGVYRLNLLALFNPLDRWSSFYTGVKRGGDYEGFAYLGLGTMLMIVSSFIAWIGNESPIKKISTSALPLCVVCFLLVVYSLSDHIAAGPKELFRYSLPSIADKLTSAFRCSGRFVWIPIYLIELLAFRTLLRSMRATRSVALLGCCAALQLVDISHASAIYKENWAVAATSPLVSAFWNQVPRQYRRIEMVLPVGQRVAPLTLLALRNGMSINDAERARLDSKVLVDSQENVLSDIKSGRLRSDTLYVFRNSTLWNYAISQAGQEDFVGVVDGYQVLAPHWDGCIDSCNLTRASITKVQYADDLTLTLGLGSLSSNYVVSGWSAEETTGRWADARTAGLIFLVRESRKPTNLHFKLSGFAPRIGEYQKVTVLINGRPAARWHVPSGVVEENVEVVPSDFNSTHGLVEVRFVLPDAASPKSVGLSDDDRELSIFLRSVEIMSPKT